MTASDRSFVATVVAAVALLPASTGEAEDSALFAPVSPTLVAEINFSIILRSTMRQDDFSDG